MPSLYLVDWQRNGKNNGKNTVHIHHCIYGHTQVYTYIYTYVHILYQYTCTLLLGGSYM